MGFFSPPTLCICWPKQGGGDRSGRRDQPLSQSFWPLCSSGSRTGGVGVGGGSLACTRAHTCTGKKSTQRSPGVRSFHQGGRGEGWRVRPSEAQGVGTGWGGAGGGVGVHGDKSPLPPLAWRGVNLKGCSVSPRQTGVRRGAGRLNLRRAVAPLVNTGSSTLPSYP